MNVFDPFSKINDSSRLLGDWEEEDTQWKQITTAEQANDKEQWITWQKQLLQEFTVVEDSKRVNGEEEIEDVPETVRRAQLKEILVSRLKEIPARYHDRLMDEFLNRMYRFGPAQELWERDYVSDIQMYIPFDRKYKQIFLYTERGERKQFDKTVGFRDYDDARDWLNTHLSKIGLRYDPARVQMDGTFPNGERIHVISGPVGYSMFLEDGTYLFVRCMIITIRRFVRSFTIEQLAERSQSFSEVPTLTKSNSMKKHRIHRKTLYTPATGGVADVATLETLAIAVQMAVSLLVAGGTGSGKTTIANALTAFVPDTDVLLILEESPECQPQNGRPAIRIYQRGDSFTLADGMKGALRMFPDRIFVSEIRDSLAFTFIQAVQSGHDGSITTLHASSCRAAISRAIDMATGHPSKPDASLIRQIIYERIGLIIHATRSGTMRFFDEIIQLLPDGTEHTVMKFVQTGTELNGNPVGYFEFFGPTDDFVEQMLRANIEIPESWGWSVETVEEGMSA